MGRLRHRRLPHRHRQARQHGVLAGVRARRSATHAAGRSATTTSSPSARSSTPTRPTCRRSPPRAASTRPSTSASRARAPASPRAGRPRRLRDFYAADDRYTDTDSNAYSLPTFLGNHDMGRIGTFLAGGDGDELLERDRLAHALMYLTRGQPVVYYGDEQGFTGDGGDKDARQDMFAEPGGVLQRRRPDRHRRHDGHRQLSTRRTRSTAPSPRPGPAARGTTPRSPTAPSCTATPATAPASTRSAASTPSEDREYVVARQQRDHRQDGHLRHRDARAAPSGRSWPASRDDAAQRRRGPGHRHRAAAVRGGLARRRHPGRRATDAPAVHFDKPSAGGVVGGRAPRSPSRSRTAASTRSPSPGGRSGGDAWTAARHRRQRAVPRLPRRRRPAQGHAARVPRRAARQQRQPVGGLDVRHGRRPGRRPAARRGGGTGPVTQPTAVSMPGTPNSEMGCPGDWHARLRRRRRCRSTPTTWCGRGTSSLPAGAYAYKAAIDKLAGTRTTAPAARPAGPTSRSASTRRGT